MSPAVDRLGHCEERADHLHDERAVERVGRVLDPDGTRQSLTIATTSKVPSFTSKPFILLGGVPPVAVIDDFSWRLIGRTPGGNLKRRRQPASRFQGRGPAADRHTALRGRRQHPRQRADRAVHELEPEQSYKVNGLPFVALPGRFLITPPSDVSGEAGFQFSLGGLQPGVQLRFNVTGVYFADVAGG